MFYNKNYVISDYLNYTDMNDLVDKIKDLLTAFENIVDLTDTSRYDRTMVEYELNDFPYIEDINTMENNIAHLSYDFYQPEGYIQNKVWIEDNTQATYKSISADDLNRMINNINTLYANKDDTRTMYNLYTHEIWDGSSSLVWEE